MFCTSHWSTQTIQRALPCLSLRHIYINIDKLTMACTRRNNSRRASMSRSRKVEQDISTDGLSSEESDNNNMTSGAYWSNPYGNAAQMDMIRQTIGQAQGNLAPSGGDISNSPRSTTAPEYDGPTIGPAPDTTGQTEGVELHFDPRCSPGEIPWGYRKYLTTRGPEGQVLNQEDQGCTYDGEPVDTHRYPKGMRRLLGR